MVLAKTSDKFHVTNFRFNHGTHFKPQSINIKGNWFLCVSLMNESKYILDLYFYWRNTSILHQEMLYGYIVSSSITCQQTGYSQSRSRPWNPYFSMKFRALSINFFLDAWVATIRLYLLPSESFQPPRATNVLIPLFFNPET